MRRLSNLFWENQGILLCAPYVPSKVLTTLCGVSLTISTPACFTVVVQYVPPHKVCDRFSLIFPERYWWRGFQSTKNTVLNLQPPQIYLQSDNLLVYFENSRDSCIWSRFQFELASFLPNCKQFNNWSHLLFFFNISLMLFILEGRIKLEFI